MVLLLESLNIGAVFQGVFSSSSSSLQEQQTIPFSNKFKRVSARRERSIESERGRIEHNAGS